MKNTCLFLFTIISFCAAAQNSSLQTDNASINIKPTTLTAFQPKATHVSQKMPVIKDLSFAQENIRVVNAEKKTLPASTIALDKFKLIGKLNSIHASIEDKAKLSVFNENDDNKETGVYSFQLKNTKWKGAPYIYCTNCGTAVLQLQAEKNKKYLIQFSLSADEENTYELLLYPNMMTPESFSFTAGAQELAFIVEGKASGYLTYYLRCVKPGSWHLSKVSISEQ